MTDNRPFLSSLLNRTALITGLTLTIVAAFLVLGERLALIPFIDRSTLQIWSFPVVILLATLVSVRFKPLLAIAIISLGTLWLGWIVDSYYLQGCKVCLGNQTGDWLGGGTHRIGSRFNHSGLLFDYAHLEFSNSESSMQFLSDNPKAIALIAPKFKDLTVWFKEVPSHSINDLNPVWSISDFGKLKLINAFSKITLSIDRGDRSYQFVALLLNAYRKLFEMKTIGDLNLRDLSDQIENPLWQLLAAGELPGMWSSYAHRAYPLMLVGNLYVWRALNSQEPNLADLECAIKKYNRAIDLLFHPSVRLERLSVVNNLLVAQFLKHRWLGSSKSLKVVQKRAKKLLRQVTDLSPSNSDLTESVWNNWQIYWSNVKEQARSRIGNRNIKRKSKKRSSGTRNLKPRRHHPN